MKNIKAQIQMTENIAIMIVIVFLLVFGFIFYAKVKKTAVKEQIKEYSDLDLVKASQSVSNLPELSCSLGALSEVGCLNRLKVEAFVALNMSNSSNYFEYYRNIFGKSKVIVKSIFPDEFNITLYDNPYDDFYNEDPIYIPINIYDPVEDYFNFGYIQVVKYSRII